MPDVYRMASKTRRDTLGWQTRVVTFLTVRERAAGPVSLEIFRADIFLDVCFFYLLEIAKPNALSLRTLSLRAPPFSPNLLIYRLPT